MKRFGLVFILMLAVIWFTACSNTDGENQAAGNHDHGAGHAGHGEAAPDTSKAVWKLSPEKPQADAETTIAVQIQDGAGKAVEHFDVSHEKLMHLIVVNKDLSYFDHIHPDYKGAGQFAVTTRFPAAGDYKLFADYVVTGSEGTTKSNWITVEGTASPAEPIVPDQVFVKTVAGKEVSLSYDSLTVGKEVTLTFHLTDETSNQPITDLEPYLGAVGHVVILSADAEQYLHVHPADEKAKGPDAKFVTTFPKSGVYKIWGQFQHNGQNFIVPFVVNVP